MSSSKTLRRLTTVSMAANLTSDTSSLLSSTSWGMIMPLVASWPTPRAIRARWRHMACRTSQSMSWKSNWGHKCLLEWPQLWGYRKLKWYYVVEWRGIIRSNCMLAYPLLSSSLDQTFNNIYFCPIDHKENIMRFFLQKLKVIDNREWLKQMVSSVTKHFDSHQSAIHF